MPHASLERAMTMTVNMRWWSSTSSHRALILSLLLSLMRVSNSFAFWIAASPGRSRKSFPQQQQQQHSKHTSFRTTFVKMMLAAESFMEEKNNTNYVDHASENTSLCYFKRTDGSWKPRKELKHLKIGERLFATRLPNSDLLEGRTGPKAFLECGIGRRNSYGKWNVVNGMIRLGKRGMKASVVRKKLQKLIPPEVLIEVYVSKIRSEEGCLEVCLHREEALEREEESMIQPFQQRKNKISASTLRIGDTLRGIVTNVTSYGIFVDVNANRNGLLHINKVAKYHDRYIEKEDGLKALGLGKGSKINVIVVSNARKRLELDLAPSLPKMDEDHHDRASNNIEDADIISTVRSDNIMSLEDDSHETDRYDRRSGVAHQNYTISDEEAAMWAAYSLDNQGYNEDVDQCDDSDSYDEDTDIEDALGIGYY